MGSLLQELDVGLSIAFRLLLISIVMVPTLALSNGRTGQSIVAVFAAAALAFTGYSARAADVTFVAQVTRYLKLVAAVPAIWMIIQILPMPSAALSHSIWNNAGEALSNEISGHISVDIGATIEALAVYLSNISLIIVTVFVAKDRRKAELLLFALTAISTLTIIVLLFGKSGLIAGVASRVTNEAISAFSALAFILLLTVGVQSVERHESKRAEAKHPKHTVKASLMLCGAGLLICIAGLVSSATLNTTLVVVFGVLTFGSIQAIRRADLAGWATGIFTVTLATAAAMVVLWRYDSVRALSPFLQFGTSAAPDTIQVVQRMLSDASWLGTGMGAFAQLLPIYQAFGSTNTNALSTAAAFAIGLGWPMTILTIAMAIGLAIVLFRGAIIRGRDSFYPAAAAACTVILVGQAFCDSSLLYSCIATIGAITIGLGLAQSRSQGSGA